jgi:hypothetical protein
MIRHIPESKDAGKDYLIDGWFWFTYVLFSFILFVWIYRGLRIH